MTRAGELRHLITLQKRDPAAPPSLSSVGEPVTTWLDVGTAYARIEPISGAEQIAAAQRAATTTHKVSLYYDSRFAAIDASWRVKYGTRYFPIDSVLNPLEDGRWLELQCTEGIRQE